MKSDLPLHSPYPIREANTKQKEYTYTCTHMTKIEVEVNTSIW